MRLALISDVHGNLEALEAVLDHIDVNSPDARIVCAGDIVGYGADPEACIDRIRERAIPCVMGNHEEMVLGRRNFSCCGHAGITAAVWTRRRLSTRMREFMESLAPHLEAAPGVIVCHGDLADAGTYVSDFARGNNALAQLRSARPDARILVCGHTHEATLHSPRGFERVPVAAVRDLDAGTAYLVNPGAVGQSREPVPLARYALLDLDRSCVSFHAQPYDHSLTVRKMRSAGLVPAVVLQRPKGIRRYVESLMRRWARHWAERDRVE
jgi:predicted phosphodiesterase